MARRKGGKRVLGPYPYRGRWRLFTVDAEGERDPQYFETEKEALSVKKALLLQIGEAHEKTVGEAIDGYELYLRDEKGNRPGSVVVTIHRLKTFFTDHDLSVAKLNQARAARYYAEVTKRTRPLKAAEGETKQVPLSVDTHRNMLSEARSFLKWCYLKKGWTKGNALDGVEGIGKRNHGKPQLRIDEFRKFASKALDLAQGGDDGAIAALMTGMLGLRAQEVTQRVVRDLDDEGRVLWIEKAKTEKGNRSVEVPDMLRLLLLRQVEGKQSGDLIFARPKGGAHWRDWPRENVQRICRLVGVPEVCAHSMRGLHSTLAFARGATGHLVAEALGHEDVSTTLRSYADPTVVRAAKQRSFMRVLQGGAG